MIPRQITHWERVQNQEEELEGCRHLCSNPGSVK